MEFPSPPSIQAWDFVPCLEFRHEISFPVWNSGIGFFFRAWNSGVAFCSTSGIQAWTFILHLEFRLEFHPAPGIQEWNFVPRLKFRSGILFPIWNLGLEFYSVPGIQKRNFVPRLESWNPGMKFCSVSGIQAWTLELKREEIHVLSCHVDFRAFLDMSGRYVHRMYRTNCTVEYTCPVLSFK